MAIENLKNATALLQRLVEINSGTANIEGVNTIQRMLREILVAQGMTVSLISNPLGTEISGDFLVAEKKGNTDRWITFVAHADTVFELNSGFHEFTLNGDDHYAIGPGVIDNKGGIVVALWALEQIFQMPQEYSLRFVISPNEETGSIGFHSLLKELGSKSSFIFGFEPSFEDGAFVNRRQGNRWYELSIQGREAHSGREHKVGVNAAFELAAKIVELQKMISYSSGTTVSIGRIEGGQDKFNIVCGYAHAKIDLRFEDRQEGDQISKRIEALLLNPLTRSGMGQAPGCSFRIVDDCPPFRNTAESDKLSAKLQKIISHIEKEDCPYPRLAAAADTSYMAHEKAIVLDGLGVRGSCMHQTKECVYLPSLETRSKAIAQLIKDL